MRPSFAPLFFIASLLATVLPSHARLVKEWTPDELARDAEVICNGIVEQVGTTPQKKELRGVPMVMNAARIKVIAGIKGDAPDQFELRYPSLDVKALPDGGIVNGPIQIGLAAGKRYRFYLRKEKERLVAVLDGDFDDGASVVPMARREADDNPPLLKKEGLEIATAYYRKQLPSAKIMPGVISTEAWDSGGWKVDFRSRAPLNYPSFTSDATILVNADRSVDPRSAIGTEFPIRADKLDKTFIGREVRMLVAPDGNGSGFYTVRGIIEKLDGKTITGNFTWEAETRLDGRKTIPRKSIDSIQLLIDLR